MKVIAAWLRRGMKSLFVLNLAALWLLLREGRKMAVAYMRQAYTLYLHRAFLPLSDDCSAPFAFGGCDRTFP